MDKELRRAKAQVVINKYAAEVGTWPGRVLQVPVAGQLFGWKAYEFAVQTGAENIARELAPLFDRKLTPSEEYAFASRAVAGIKLLVELVAMGAFAFIPFIGGEISTNRAAKYLKTAGWSIYFMMATGKSPSKMTDGEIKNCIQKGALRAKKM